MPQPPSPFSLTLSYLRSAAGWTKRQLARAQGLDESLISAYERGAKPLNREQLDSLVETLGHPPEVIDVFLSAHSLIFPKPQPGTSSAFPLSAEENRAVDRAAMAAAWTAGHIAAERVRGEFVRRIKEEKTEAARQEAEVLFRGLTSVTSEERSGLVHAFPDYWTWSLALRLCEASVKSTAQNTVLASELAELAVSIAERLLGAEGWSSRLTGYCWAHVANARRVSNDLIGSEKAFARSREFWQAGSDADPEILSAWVLPSMEASLKRAQRRFSEALELLEMARRSRGGSNPEALVYLLLQKEHVYVQMGDTKAALAALIEASPFVEASGDPRKLFAIRFNMADDLCQLERYKEAEELLSSARHLAIEQVNDLDLIRVGWLTAKIAAGQGHTEEAIAGLEQVSRDFTERQLPYDAALSSLDLAELWLAVGRPYEAKILATALGWIFTTKGIHREALASLGLFCEAAFQEQATVDLARQAMTRIKQVRRSASSLPEGRPSAE